MPKIVKPLILGFDIDDVLSDFWSTATPIFNRKYGIEASKNDFVTFQSMNHIYGIEYPEFFKTVVDEGVFETMKPYKGVPKVMQALHSQGHRLILVTSRSFHPHAKPMTEDFLRRNDIPYHELHIKADGKTKAEYLPHGTHSFIDDLPDNLYHIGESGKVDNLALVTQPWNKSNSDFDRYHGLEHFYQKNFAQKYSMVLNP